MKTNLRLIRNIVTTDQTADFCELMESVMDSLSSDYECKRTDFAAGISRNLAWLITDLTNDEEVLIIFDPYEGYTHRAGIHSYEVNSAGRVFEIIDQAFKDNFLRVFVHSMSERRR